MSQNTVLKFAHSENMCEAVGHKMQYVQHKEALCR